MDTRHTTLLALPTSRPPFQFALVAPHCSWYMGALTNIAVLQRD